MVSWMMISKYRLDQMLDIVCCTMGSHLMILLLQISVSYSTRDNVLEMIDVLCNESCALNKNCACLETVNNKHNFRQNGKITSELTVSDVMKNGKLTNATFNVNNGNQPNAHLNVNKGKLPNATFNVNKGNQPKDELNVNRDKQPNATLNVNKDKKPNATLNVNKNKKPNATLNVNKDKKPNATLNVNKGNEPKTTWNINTAMQNKYFKTMSQSINRLQDFGWNVSDVGNLSIEIHQDAVEMQCFGCNGEFMLHDIHDRNRCPGCFKTMFSLKPNMFKLVPLTDSSLTAWTTSQCVNQSSLCNICNKNNWFENRPDGVCRRLYIYSIAMSIDDIYFDFDDLDKMSYFMICYLKHNFGFHVLEEWWPPLVVFDERLETHLYVARFLVYDVHRASIKDAVNQIHQLSLMTYMLRYHLKSLLDQANQSISMQYKRLKSFDLGGRMRKVLEYYNITEVTNRSTCICKAVYGAVLETGKLFDMMNIDLSFGCFFESFDKVEMDVSQHLGFACLHLYNSCGRHVLNPLFNFIFIIHLFCEITIL